MNSPSSGSGKQVEVRGQEARGGEAPRGLAWLAPTFPRTFFRKLQICVCHNLKHPWSLCLCVCARMWVSVCSPWSGREKGSAADWLRGLARREAWKAEVEGCGRASPAWGFPKRKQRRAEAAAADIETPEV